MATARNRPSVPLDDEELATRLFASVAAILLRLGFDAPKAERLVREAFVLAAADNARTSARQATQSRIASIAGISRLDVRNILRARRSGIRRSKKSNATRIESLIAGWKSDSRFREKSGKPKALDFSGPKSGFSKLVKTYGRDVTARVLRDQLVRLKIVREEGTKLFLLNSAHHSIGRSAAAQNDLKFLAMRAEEFNWKEGRRAFSTAKIAIPVSEKKTAQRIRQIATERILIVLKSLGDLGDQDGTQTEKGRKSTNRVVISAAVAADLKESAQ